MDTTWLRDSVISHPLMLVVGIALVLAISLSIRAREPNERSIDDVIAQAKAGNIEKITDEGETMTLELRDPQQKARVRKDPNTDVSALLRVTGVPPEQIGRIQVEYRQPPEFGSWISRTVQFLPFLVLVLFLLVMARRAQGAQNHAQG